MSAKRKPAVGNDPLAKADRGAALHAMPAAGRTRPVGRPAKKAGEKITGLSVYPSPALRVRLEAEWKQRDEDAIRRGDTNAIRERGNLSKLILELVRERLNFVEPAGQ